MAKRMFPASYPIWELKVSKSESGLQSLILMLGNAGDSANSEFISDGISSHTEVKHSSDNMGLQGEVGDD